MKCKCPYCGEVQNPNSKVGDLDECNECEKVYQQHINAVS